MKRYYYNQETDEFRVTNPPIFTSEISSGFVEITRSEYSEFYANYSPPSGMQRKKYTYPLEMECIPDATDEELANAEQLDMVTELEWCDLQMKLHSSSDSRAILTLDDIYAYARACRDYVQNIDGELTIMTDKPVRPE